MARCGVGLNSFRWRHEGCFARGGEREGCCERLRPFASLRLTGQDPKSKVQGCQSGKERRQRRSRAEGKRTTETELFSQLLFAHPAGQEKGPGKRNACAPPSERAEACPATKKTILCQALLFCLFMSVLLFGLWRLAGPQSKGKGPLPKRRPKESCCLRPLRPLRP